MSEKVETKTLMEILIERQKFSGEIKKFNEKNQEKWVRKEDHDAEIKQLTLFSEKALMEKLSTLKVSNCYTSPDEPPIEQVNLKDVKVLLIDVLRTESHLQGKIEAINLFAKKLNQKREKDNFFEPDLSDFLANEDDRGKIYDRGVEDGKLEILRSLIDVSVATEKSGEQKQEKIT